MFDEDYGVQSYFGESGDCDFFGDTSMSGGFASGMGEAGFVSEAFAQDSIGGSFFTEASKFDTTGGGCFTECGDLYEESSNSTRSHFGDMAETDAKSRIESDDKALRDISNKGKKPPSGRQNYTSVTPYHRRALDSARAMSREYPDYDSTQVELSRQERKYGTAKRHGKEIGKHIDSNK